MKPEATMVLGNLQGNGSGANRGRAMEMAVGTPGRSDWQGSWLVELASELVSSWA